MSAFLDQFGNGAWALAAFIVLLGPIITVHEWGHFFVARRCGVHVIRFSIGFGKPLWMRTGRDGTEYVLAAVPLGGFVRMLDEREGVVPPERLHEAFNRKPVAQRFAIVAAGPLVNLLFAVLIYWLVFIVGSQQMAPIIGHVYSDSAAAHAGIAAGDEILAIDGEDVRRWDDVPLRLVAWVGDTGVIRFHLRSGAAGLERDVDVPVAAFMRGQENRSPTELLGITPWYPSAPAVVGEVPPEVKQGERSVASPAKAAGMQKDDHILAVDGQPVADWASWVDRVRTAPGKSLRVDVERAGSALQVTLVPLPVTNGDRVIGVVGTVMKEPEKLKWPRDWPAEYVRDVRYGPVEALGRAVGETWNLSRLTVVTIGKMLAGKMSMKSVGGPLTIAQGAGVTASIGIGVFLGFMAFLSVSIGVLNLLPIPVLDGGHLVFYAYEALRGKPVPERVQNIALQVGVTLLVGLMLLAFYNDFARLFARL